MEKQTKNVTVDYYITEDGKSFTNENLALQHERDLRYYRIKKSMKKMNLSLPEFLNFEEDEWYFIANKEQLEWFLNEYRTDFVDGKYNSNGSKINTIIGDWFIKTLDHNDQINVYTLKYVLNEMKKFIENVESKTVDGQF